MKKIYYPARAEYQNILKRPSKRFEDLEATVEEVFSEVQRKGDDAVSRYSGLFDGVIPESIQVGLAEFDGAEKNISEKLKQAIKLAKDNITAFHQAQQGGKVSLETMKGVKCWQEKRPIQRVGLYIPGGTAPLFSTVLMLAIPAKLAGCDEIVICSPPKKDGSLDPVILYTAALCGIKNVFKVGGIQAIAALTFGTAAIPKVYKIFGPGNQYVTVAKQSATKYGVAIDMPAGPSELLVFTDNTANAAFVASDLLSQAEHGADSQVIFVTTSEKMISEVETEIRLQLEDLPRKEIAAQALQHSKLILVESSETALDLINEYGPEHFIVCAADENYFAERICNAGSVFVGAYTPESAGDYASGTNHTLPTNGNTKQYSGVNLDSFMKSISFQQITAEGLKNLGPAIEEMASAEGLQAHKNAVTIRLNSLRP